MIAIYQNSNINNNRIKKEAYHLIKEHIKIIAKKTN